MVMNVQSSIAVSNLFLWEATDLCGLETANLVHVAARIVWEAVLLVSAWVLWNDRNKLEMEAKSSNGAPLTSYLILKSSCFCGYISSTKSMLMGSWTEWANFPLSSCCSTSWCLGVIC